MDLIDRQAVLTISEKYHGYMPNDIEARMRCEIRELPTVTERKTGRWIETEGLDEEIRCLMCTNHMRSDLGCDGACQYNEHVYKKIMSALERRMIEVEHD